MDTDNRKILSALCHGAIFFNTIIVSIAIPITILVLTNDSVVKDNAKESLNFSINIFSMILILLISLEVTGLALLLLLGIFICVMPIIAIFNVIKNPNKPYRYPFIFHLL